MEKREKTLNALKMAKEAVNQANEALNAAIKELDEESLTKVTGGNGSLWNDVPKVDEHEHNENDKTREGMDFF